MIHRWLAVAAVVTLWLLVALIVAAASLSFDELWRVLR
jgi:hypothetical protein